MFKEIEGRWTCTKCCHVFSAMMGDDEIPEKCSCEKEALMEEDMTYYYNPTKDEDFIRIAIDVYGSGVRDNTREQLIQIGKDYHINGEADVDQEISDAAEFFWNPEISLKDVAKQIQEHLKDEKNIKVTIKRIMEVIDHE